VKRVKTMKVMKDMRYESYVGGERCTLKCVLLICAKEMERQVEEQSARRRDLEMTLKLLEKDAWAKQATVGALRKQLEDIKVINQDIGSKIQVQLRPTVMLFSLLVDGV